MKKINDVTYEVQPDERITIRVTPTDFGDSLSSVEAVLDKKKLPNSGTEDAPVFKFTVTKPVGKRHRVFIEFTFLSDSPDEACYQVQISGQNDEGCPCEFSICKTDNAKGVNIGFDVV